MRAGTEVYLALRLQDSLQQESQQGHSYGREAVAAASSEGGGGLSGCSQNIPEPSPGGETRRQDRRNSNFDKSRQRQALGTCLSNSRFGLREQFSRMHYQEAFQLIGTLRPMAVVHPVDTSPLPITRTLASERLGGPNTQAVSL
jgi:hypothetical protein